MDYFQTYQDMIRLRGLAEHTVKSYSTYVRAYLTYIEKLGVSPENTSWDIMRGFILNLKISRNLNDRTINAVISQLQFFYVYVLHRPWDKTQIPMRKFDTYLPYVPSRNTVCTFINSIDDNIRFKAIIVLLYSAGLRVGEVCNLLYDDVSRENMNIHIRHSKNRSDRYVALSSVALKILTQYWRSCGKPKGFLFPKIRGVDQPLDTFYVCRHIAMQEDKLGWKHNLTPHSFRHAFATHLYEDTKDIVLVKTMLGHRSLNSSTIYIHLASISSGNWTSPMDRMDIRL